jgi:hypothetical protein
MAQNTLFGHKAKKRPTVILRGYFQVNKSNLIKCVVEIN